MPFNATENALQRWLVPGATSHLDLRSALILGVKVKQLSVELNLASLTLLVYEWLLNLPLEIVMIWRSRWSIVKILYLLTRYMAYGDVIILVWEQLSFNLSASKCRAAYTAFGYLFSTGFHFAELLLVIRVWAVWGRQLKMAVVLFAFWAGVVAASYTNITFFLSEITFVNSIPHIPGCVVTSTSIRLYINWILLMAIDIAMSSLMVVKGYRSYVSGGNSQLMKVVFRDGILYYIYLVILSMVNAIVILILPPEYMSLLGLPMHVIHSVLTCRLVLDTRKQARALTIVLGEDVAADGAMAEESIGPIGTLRFAATEPEQP